MVSEKMKPFMANNSAIRAMFEEGKKMAAVYGAENVYDFSLGNPNVPVPEVNEAILEIVKDRGSRQRPQRDLKEHLKPWRPGDRIRPVLCGVRRLCEEL